MKNFICTVNNSNVSFMFLSRDNNLTKARPACVSKIAKPNEIILYYKDERKL